MFLDELQTDAAVLPRIVALGDIDETNCVHRASPNPDGGAVPLEIAPKLGELDRRLTLAKLVGAWARSPVSAPLVVGGPASTLALAGDLARLIDDMVTRGVDWDGSTGWCRTYSTNTGSTRSIPAIRATGPNYLAEIGKIEPAARRDH